MLAFLQQNLATILISTVLLFLLALAIRYIIRKARRGECAGCSRCRPGNGRTHCDGCRPHCTSSPEPSERANTP